MTELLVFRALWGMEQPDDPFERKIERIAEAGCDGVEGFVLASSLPPSEFARVVRANGLKLIVVGQVDWAEDLAPALEQLASYDPLKLGIHPGRDSMTRDEASAFFEEALHVEERIGIPVAHETHRGRILFTPWDTLHYLRQFDSLKLVADYSHWVNVCERHTLPHINVPVADNWQVCLWGMRRLREIWNA